MGSRTVLMQQMKAFAPSFASMEKKSAWIKTVMVCLTALMEKMRITAFHSPQIPKVR